MEHTVVVPEAGLHARPASTLVQTANRFDADVSIGRAADDTVSATSMLSVSGLNVAHGETVRVVAYEHLGVRKSAESVRMRRHYFVDQLLDHVVRVVDQFS
jgi:phosphocarrier protein